MKFTNGYWLVRDGITPHFATQALDAERRGDELAVYAAVRPTRSRGDTLNAPLITARFSSPAEGVIRVRVITSYSIHYTKLYERRYDRRRRLS